MLLACAVVAPACVCCEALLWHACVVRGSSGNQTLLQTDGSYQTLLSWSFPPCTAE